MSDAASPLADPQQIQGNVLRPFGGRHQAFLFLTFRSNRSGARSWLGAAATRVAGTTEVHALRTSPDPTPALLNIGLTATGLVLLHPEVARDLVGHDAFWRGPLGLRLDDANQITTAPALLGDVGRADPRSWVIGGPDGPPVDALLTLAADDEQALDEAIRREEQAAEEAGLRILPVGDERVQRGQVLRDEANRPVEHFGFADGISQPGVRGYTDPATLRPGSPMIAAGEFILGCPGERRPQTWAPRPPAAPWMHGGSFQVFRRLRQDPAGWWARMAQLAGDGDGDGAEDAAAHAVGRRLDGTPLAAQPEGADQNDFTYSDDEKGARTALYAHIRKVNPRQDDVFRDRSRKMLRRGIPFGPPFDRDHPDDRERGLLFNAYMASIEHQFEFVQRRWVGDPGFPASTLSKYGRDIGGDQRVDGLDPVLGPDEQEAAGRWPAAVVEQIPQPSFGGFVTTTGAVYAFAPSLPALHLLAGEAALTSDALAGAW